MSIATARKLPRLRRLGVLMTPYGIAEESGGVLNPGFCFSRDKRPLLLPRVVAPRNFSRIGVAEVILDRYGVPVGVDRLGYALEPKELYEIRPSDGVHPCGGVEDPRVSYLSVLDLYVMTYVAFGPVGPRIALAVSEDGISWYRLGLVKFDNSVYQGSADINNVDNKDAVFFDRTVLDPSGVESIAVLHRPTFSDGTAGVPSLPSIWISYIPLRAVRKDIYALLRWSGHRVVAEPKEGWEALKIGAGTPPVLTRDGWFLLYHGVHFKAILDTERKPCYCPGSMILDANDPGIVRARSQSPLLLPTAGEECDGVVPNVIFPTALAGRYSFYGMGDSAIGVCEVAV